MTEKLFRVQNYLVGEVVGKGQFANVYVCYTNTTQCPLAARFVFKRKVQKCLNCSKISFNESILCALLIHPNISRVLDLFETRAAYVQISKLYENSDLLTLLRHSSFSKMLCIQIIKELLLAIHYLHSHHIIHRDIKLENVLLTPTRHVKLTDFGLSTISFNGMVDDFCGSLPYLPPEVFSGKPFNGFKVDIWSIGIVSYSIFARTLPYKNVSSQYDFKDPIDWTPIPSDVQPLIQSMLLNDPNQRPTASQALLDPIFNLTQNSIPTYDVDSPIPFPRSGIVSRLCEILSTSPQELLADLSPIADSSLPLNSAIVTSSQSTTSTVDINIKVPRSPSLSAMYSYLGFSSSHDDTERLPYKNVSLHSMTHATSNFDCDIAIKSASQAVKKQNDIRRRRGKMTSLEMTPRFSLPRLLYHLMQERDSTCPFHKKFQAQNWTRSLPSHSIGLGLTYKAKSSQVIREAQNFLATVNGCISTPAALKREMVLNGPQGDSRLKFECYDEESSQTCTLFLTKEGELDEISRPLLDHLSRTFSVLASFSPVS